VDLYLTADVFFISYFTNAVSGDCSKILHHA